MDPLPPYPTVGGGTNTNPTDQSSCAKSPGTDDLGESMDTSKRKRGRPKKLKGMPRRPLSAYNLCKCSEQAITMPPLLLLLLLRPVLMLWLCPLVFTHAPLLLCWGALCWYGGTLSLQGKRSLHCEILCTPA
jgi:hypothetical protein